MSINASDSYVEILIMREDTNFELLLSSGLLVLMANKMV